MSARPASDPGKRPPLTEITIESINGFEAENLEQLSEAEADRIRARADVLGPSYQLFYERPIEAVGGRGAHLAHAAPVGHPGQRQQQPRHQPSQHQARVDLHSARPSISPTLASKSLVANGFVM